MVIILQGTPLEQVCSEYEDHDETGPFEGRGYCCFGDRDVQHPKRDPVETIELLLKYGADPNLASNVRDDEAKYHGPLELIKQDKQILSRVDQDKINLLFKYGARPRAWRLKRPVYTNPLVKYCAEGMEEEVGVVFEESQICV